MLFCLLQGLNAMNTSRVSPRLSKDTKDPATCALDLVVCVCVTSGDPPLEVRAQLVHRAAAPGPPRGLQPLQLHQTQDVQRRLGPCGADPAQVLHAELRLMTCTVRGSGQDQVRIRGPGQDQGARRGSGARGT